MAYVGPKTTAGKDRIMVYGPKEDGTYVVEFRTAAGQAMAISIPRTNGNNPALDALRTFRAATAPETRNAPTQKMNKEINAGLSNPKTKAQLADLGGGEFATTPAEFGKFIAEETRSGVR